MKTISISIFDQMKQDQLEIHNTLSQLFTQRENALEQKLNTNLEMIMAKLCTTPNSPTRKKSIIHHDTINIPNNSDTDQHMLSTPTSFSTAADGTNNEYINPYNKNSLRRRSVTESHPTERL
jgi:hypothetical protein